MRTLNYGHWPAELSARQKTFEKNLHWIAAIDISDHGDDGPLLKLIGGQEPIPPELRPAIAAALGGSRKKRNASKSKIPLRHRLLIACVISDHLGFVDEFKNRRFANGRKWMDFIADRNGCEPRDVLRDLERNAAQYIHDAARDHGVHEETIKTMVRDIRKKMISYPNV